MPVRRRVLTAFDLGGVPCLGAVRTAEGVVAGFRPGTPAEALGEVLRLGWAGRAPVALLAGGRADGEEAEPEEFRDRNVLLAVRNGERAEDAVAWLAFHAGEAGATAALILDRDPPGGEFADALDALSPALPVTVVTADRPLGREDGPDLRDPSTAPAAPKRGTVAADPWHSPLAAASVFELLRHRFLSAARAVALLDIADLLLPVPERGAVFDLAARHPGGYVPLRGIETYPWRLRKGAPAPHADHIAHRQGERRRVLSWCAAPGGMAPGVVWTPGRLSGLPVAEARPMPFARAMGVAYPGAPPERLVRKADLRETAQLVELMTRAFGAAPVRLPAPPPIPPRPATQRTTVVTAMKNEGPFVLDWIAHNRALGIDRHLVYTNDCADGTDRMLDLLAEAGVTRRDNPYRETGQDPQHAAFRAAEAEAAVTGADWLTTLDVDEYIDIHAGEGRLADLLDAAPDAHVFSMPWRLFGNADRHGFEDRPVTELFPLAAPEYAPRPLQAWAFKSLYRNAGLFRRMGVHRPKGLAREAGLVWVDGSGRPLPPAVRRGAWRMSTAHWGYGLVTLNHYAVRTAESFLVKRERGRVNHTDREQGTAYWFRMNHNAEEAPSIRRHDKRVARGKAALLALPGVAEAHEAAVAWHRERIAALLETRDYAELFAAITSPRAERLSRMATSFGMAVHMAGPEAIPDEVAARDPGEPFFWTLPGR
jgi:hypothetical protein